MSFRTIACRTGGTLSRLPMMSGIALGSSAFVSTVPALLGLTTVVITTPIFWVVLGATGYNLIKAEIILNSIDDGRLEIAGYAELQNAFTQNNLKLKKLKAEKARQKLASIEAEEAVLTAAQSNLAAELNVANAKSELNPKKEKPFHGKTVVDEPLMA